MPAKSQHGKSKRTARSKRKGVRTPSVILSQKPAVLPSVAVPSVVLPRAATSASYPYLTADLKRVGLLSGIILIILLVLYFTIS
ncbi:MAG: hypothetical protein WC369_02410 [Dehalococcoidales bacterium]|jgi:hypothetical protein